MVTSIYSHDIQGIISATHQGPHHILGIHMIDAHYLGQKKTIPTIRVFMPDAQSVLVVDNSDGGKEYEMERVHDGGLFEAIFWNKEAKFDYKIRVKSHSGDEWLQDDPYAQWVEEITEFDRYLFNRSQHYKIYEKMGAHIKTVNGKKGTYFSVWAPDAKRVSIVGNFNGWDGRKDVMEKLHDAGVWVLFKPGVGEGEAYKFEILTHDGRVLQKADPYASYAELRPKTASVVYTLEDYQWKDDPWIEKRSQNDPMTQPTSIYEVHLGSWMRIPEEENRFLTYREFAERLIPYVKRLGFTHIELMPVEEHPFDGSWGYQVTGYFAPTSRFGTPEDLQFFIDMCHQNDIGVILDWVPGHFPKDAHGLADFDGYPLYEYGDPRKGEHIDWGTKIFDYGRLEVKNFLISNALYWVDKFHFDGLRVDAVASMLYLDYSRAPGQWIPNVYGGRENLEAIEFMKHMNSIMYHYFPGVLMVAEESTSFPGVSKPTYMGGLGFGFKWNMGWMNDTLRYMAHDAVYRKFHHGELTFSFIYAWTENFILPISHDEVVHGKGSMIQKMPGDDWQKFANLRSFYTYMWAHPGKQLLFMGQEFGQWSEWSEGRSLDWHLLEHNHHAGLQGMICELNKVYRENPALWERDFDPEAFVCINCDDGDNSILSFMRRGFDEDEFVICVINFTPVVRDEYTIGVPYLGSYTEIFNSDSDRYGGSNVMNKNLLKAVREPANYQPYSLKLKIPPLGGVMLKMKTKYKKQ